MHDFVQYVVGGLGFGGIYALAALGLVLIFKTSGVVHFAFGAMGCGGFLSCPPQPFFPPRPGRWRGGWFFPSSPALPPGAGGGEPPPRPAGRPRWGGPPPAAT